MSNSNTNLQTQSLNALHNAIMEAGSKDRPPMLAPGNYVQWKSIIKRYIDTKPNSELIYYCLQNPPYTYQWTKKTVPVVEGSSETTTESSYFNYNQNGKVPAEDEAPIPPLPPSFLAPRIRPLSPRALKVEMRGVASAYYHSLHPSGTPPVLPVPLPAPSTSRRADVPEADTPPRKRLLLTTPRPGCEVGESSAAAAARQP
ncbi:hypothetical protein Tco_0111194 [Tanacetum coccineum]